TEDVRGDLRRRRDLAGRTVTPALGRWLDRRADEPSAEPSWRDLRHRSRRAAVERAREGRQVDLVGVDEVLEALPDAPTLRRRPPVELCRIQSAGHVVRLPVPDVNALQQAR